VRHTRYESGADVTRATVAALQDDARNLPRHLDEDAVRERLLVQAQRAAVLLVDEGVHDTLARRASIFSSMPVTIVMR